MTEPFVLRLVVSSWFLGHALRLSSVELSLLLAPPLGMNSLLHSISYLRTTCLLSASFLTLYRIAMPIGIITCMLTCKPNDANWQRYAYLWDSKYHIYSEI